MNAFVLCAALESQRCCKTEKQEMVSDGITFSSSSMAKWKGHNMYQQGDLSWNTSRAALRGAMKIPAGFGTTTEDSTMLGHHPLSDRQQGLCCVSKDLVVTTGNHELSPFLQQEIADVKATQHGWLAFRQCAEFSI